MRFREGSAPRTAPVRIIAECGDNPVRSARTILLYARTDTFSTAGRAVPTSRVGPAEGLPRAPPAARCLKRRHAPAQRRGIGSAWHRLFIAHRRQPRRPVRPALVKKIADSSENPLTSVIGIATLPSKTCEEYHKPAPNLPMLPVVGTQRPAGGSRSPGPGWKRAYRRAGCARRPIVTNITVAPAAFAASCPACSAHAQSPSAGYATECFSAPPDRSTAGVSINT